MLVLTDEWLSWSWPRHTQPAGHCQEPGQSQKLLFPKDSCARLGSAFFSFVQPDRAMPATSAVCALVTAMSVSSCAVHGVLLWDKEAEVKFRPLSSTKENESSTLRAARWKGQLVTLYAASQDDSLPGKHFYLISHLIS